MQNNIKRESLAVTKSMSIMMIILLDWNLFYMNKNNVFGPEKDCTGPLMKLEETFADKDLQLLILSLSPI